MISIKSFTEKNEIKLAADVALKNKLYVSGWALSHWLKNARKFPESCLKIVLAYDDFIPVGIAITLGGGSSAVFTRKKYRRQKIGTLLVNELKKQNIELKFFPHNEINTRFFEKVL